MGDRLRAARVRKGYKKGVHAARALAVPPSTYAAHENGQNDFDPEAARFYAQKFGVSAAWLLTGEDGPDRVAPGEEFPPDQEPDAPATAGSVTGRRGIPDDSSAQLDVTAGMGAGGLTIVSSGVPGRHGMTFSAEHIADYWFSLGRRRSFAIRLPSPSLAGV